jgi:aryl-alcohol dehydrogenase-like predicted oxidoreductase
MDMKHKPELGGIFQLPGTSLVLSRIGYGAIHLAGPRVWGPPKDIDAAVALLREAVAQGVNHIDTADYYGPHITNQIVKKALHPYHDGLTIATKIGYRRGADQSWNPALSEKDLTEAVSDNLENLGLEALDLVNLRLNKSDGPVMVETAVAIMADLKRKGLIRHIGLSNVSREQFEKARSITGIVCVQNEYNLANREDDRFIDYLASLGVAYIPFFPLGGFRPIQAPELENASVTLGVSKMQVALAWLLQRSPNILLIPGTSSLDHLRENLRAADLDLPAGIIAGLDQIASKIAKPGSRIPS